MNKILETIKQKEKTNFPFKPDREFYSKININRKRWGQIFRGETAPTLPEAKSIADFFEVSVTDLIE